MLCVSPRQKIKGTKKNKFTADEDALLTQLVQNYGIFDWDTIAQKMNNRTPRQCRDRWNYYLNPNVKNRPWTPDEENILIEKYMKIGPKWAVLCQFFDSRTDANVKNHFLLIQRRIKRGNEDSFSIPQKIVEKKEIKTPEVSILEDLFLTSPGEDDSWFFC
ncbi:Myb-like DNA-binding domain containing protein [Trichomonas vaginalis G3]|uniref:Myb-like DNA-binding domain containing protein n=1 Tax=Trichomonas vaginalis (strain ATCC PRA-98 / G3) TaxID=412133 RepID=A2DVN2_TRIV3|nr:RNA polymerase II transcription regulator recruiting protein [Trichomonas vaginalis G3]EAY15574.1 Myb-like DNA-binding domain containing protein [Trichomonas vaginalis G3]KAI5526220.1 RNA polymerase II transcription regulator recruiting protein [Trichomonas vaginalis G3]|eukprot:XP_001327797.1 Myb-like DNA-binding domain containing protein [Trichomonas vaginalis G3]